MSVEGPGARWLLAAKLRIRRNRWRTADGQIFKAALLGGVGLFFWSFIFLVIHRMLLYFRNTQGIGDLLAAKLLGMALSLIHISEPTRRRDSSRMPSSA